MDKNTEYNTLYDIYISSITRFKDNVALSSADGNEMTYSEFGRKTDALSGLLLKHGVGKGDKVAILGTNSPNWVISYFAITTIGAVVVPILPDFTAFEIVNIIDHSESIALIISSRLEYKIPGHLKDKLSLVLSMDDLSVLKGDGIMTDIQPPKPSPEGIASIIYTSGTSGASKGVMLSHANLVAQTKMSFELFPIRESDIFLSILPLSHAYECSIGMLFPISFGSKVVYLNGAPTPALLMPALKSVKPTIMLSVPLIVEKIYKLKIRPMFTNNPVMRLFYSIGIIRRLLHKIAGKKLLETFGGRLRFFGIGGSKLDGAVENFLRDARFPYAIGYGLTETSPLLAGATPGKVKWQSTGPALKGIELKISNPNEKNIGEIVIKGPNVMMGYYKDSESTAKAFTQDGWFRTKDLGFMDKDGNLFIKGRRDNMIVGSNGENIYPEEIESLFNECDLVLESLVLERKGKLVARVHFNYDEIKNESLNLGDSHNTNLEEKIRKIKNEVLEFVNGRVNRSSRVNEIIEQPAPFEKTATQKIKRYLYN
ncbi:MAG: long-chain fatty acid--CoA ligase [Bacteroidia bacterium]|jgi:long-chain acyl-CoA synthetase|nr:long-chain fatty acid--CoA ligase [Bacteroidia bacterium]